MPAFKPGALGVLGAEVGINRHQRPRFVPMACRFTLHSAKGRPEKTRNGAFPSKSSDLQAPATRTPHPLLQRLHLVRLPEGPLALSCVVSCGFVLWGVASRCVALDCVVLCCVASCRVALRRVALREAEDGGDGYRESYREGTIYAVLVTAFSRVKCRSFTSSPLKGLHLACRDADTSCAARCPTSPSREKGSQRYVL